MAATEGGSRTGKVPELLTRHLDCFPPLADHIESLSAQAQHLESDLQMRLQL